METTNTITIGLTRDELALGPSVEWQTNPERFDFYILGNATERYRIAPDGMFHCYSVPAEG
jgi:hypothetical protein